VHDCQTLRNLYADIKSNEFNFFFIFCCGGSGQALSFI